MSADFSDLRIEQPASYLRQQVVEVLRKSIMDGRFSPGERLIERELCEMTGVSRTSVREALRHLEAEGLVKVLANRGPVVAEITLEEAEHLYEVRAALEGLAGRLFAERASDDAIVQLEAAFLHLKKIFEDGGSPAEVRQATTNFYDVFLGSCGNEIVANLVRSLSARVVFLRTRSMSLPGRGPQSIAEVERIVGAIKQRDPDGTQILCEEHVRRARSAALAVLQRREPVVIASGRRKT
jgi:DNA-binding GntR family transcriptional regulator